MLQRTENGKEAFAFLGGVKPKTLTFGAVYSERSDVERAVMDYVGMVPIEIRELTISEVTFDCVMGLMNAACHHDVLPDSDEVCESLNLGKFLKRRNMRYNQVRSDDFVLENIRSKKELEQAACRMMSRKTLLPELGRIFAKTSPNIYGHPVHYIIRESDADCRKEIRLALQEALYMAGRIQNKRYTVAEVFSDSEIAKSVLENLYMTNKGGVVVINYKENGEDDEDYRRPGDDTAAMLCEAAVKYRRDVLTIFIFPTECEKIRSQFFDNLPNMTFIELYSDVMFDEAARSYLKEKAKSAAIRADRNLYGCIAKGEDMNIKDLNDAFYKWYDVKMKTAIYPQYRYTEAIKETYQEGKIQRMRHRRTRRHGRVVRGKSSHQESLELPKTPKDVFGHGDCKRQVFHAYGVYRQSRNR